MDYNSYVMGIHNYYSMATHANQDFSEIGFFGQAYYEMQIRPEIEKIRQFTAPVCSGKSMVEARNCDTFVGSLFCPYPTSGRPARQSIGQETGAYTLQGAVRRRTSHWKRSTFPFYIISWNTQCQVKA